MLEFSSIIKFCFLEKETYKIFSLPDLMHGTFSKIKRQIYVTNIAIPKKNVDFLNKLLKNIKKCRSIN